MADTGNANVDTLEAVVRTLIERDGRHLAVETNENPGPEHALAALSDLAARARDRDEAREMYGRAADRMTIEIVEREAAEAEADRLARRVAELEAASREVFAAAKGLTEADVYGVEEHVRAVRMTNAITKLAALAGDGGGA